MAELNILKDVLELARSATPETVDDIVKQLYPAIVELDMTEVQAEQVFAALKEAGGTTLTALRTDFSTYQRAHGLTAEHDSVGTVLVKLAQDSGLKLWHDPEGNPWATLRVKEHAEHHPLKTKAVKRYLTHLYYLENESAPHAQGLQDALNTLESRAVFEGAEHPVFVRLAEVDGVVYLDLANEHWQVVKVTPQGWSVEAPDAVPVRFRRPGGMLPLPTPERGGSLTEFAKLLNVSLESRDWKLIVAWLLQALRGTGPYPVLVLTGGQGSGKSTAAKMLRALLDPNVSLLRSLSRNEHDLFIAAVNGWALAFDNVSGLSQWMSDALCKLATGGGLATRQLFSDAEETLLDAVRPVVLNGITDFVQRQDLVDRALQVYLPAIPDEERKLERVLWADFDEARPRVLAALLDSVVCGLQRLPHTILEGLPRLADFALWATACEAGLGWDRGAFMEAYQDAQADLIKDALETELIAAPLLSLLTLQNLQEWTGTASELLGALNEQQGYPDKRPPKGWPGAPHVLSGTLKRLTPALLAQGLEVTQLNREGKKGTKRWHLRLVEQNERQKRQKEGESIGINVRNGASTDATFSSDAPSIGESKQASAEKARKARQSGTTDASDASRAAPSKNGLHEPRKRGGMDL